MVQRAYSSGTFFVGQVKERKTRSRKSCLTLSDAELFQSLVDLLVAVIG